MAVCRITTKGTGLTGNRRAKVRFHTALEILHGANIQMDNGLFV
jgi:hypothetical protein